MRTIMLAATALTLAAGTARAASTVWQGEAFIAKTTCASLAPVGSYFTVVYQPIITAIGQDGPEALSFTDSRSVDLLLSATASKTLAGHGLFAGTEISSHATLLATTGTFTLSISPHPVALGTSKVTITGSLTNFAGTAGCDVQFNAALTPRP